MNPGQRFGHVMKSPRGEPFARTPTPDTSKPCRSPEKLETPYVTPDKLMVPKIPIKVETGQTLNNVNNVTNNSTKVINPPTKATNDDVTFNRYRNTRW